MSTGFLTGVGGVARRHRTRGNTGGPVLRGVAALGFAFEADAVLGVGGAHSTDCTDRTTKPAGREGALVRGASRRAKG